MKPFHGRIGAKAGRQSLDSEIIPHLQSWVSDAQSPAEKQSRYERCCTTFGIGEGAWDDYRVLERFELLYQLGLVAESHVDAGLREQASVEVRYPPWSGPSPKEKFEAESARAGSGESASKEIENSSLGLHMAHDHRRILATALGRLRGKLRYRPLVFDLLDETFTLLELQRVVESLAGIRLHKGNFRRLVENGRLVEGTGKQVQTGGRPAEAFRFRREVMSERRAPGLGLPANRT